MAYFSAIQTQLRHDYRVRHAHVDLAPLIDWWNKPVGVDGRRLGDLCAGSAADELLGGGLDLCVRSLQADSGSSELHAMYLRDCVSFCSGAAIGFHYVTPLWLMWVVDAEASLDMWHTLEGLPGFHRIPSRDREGAWQLGLNHICSAFPRAACRLWGRKAEEWAERITAIEGELIYAYEMLELANKTAQVLGINPPDPDWPVAEDPSLMRDFITAWLNNTATPSVDRRFWLSQWNTLNSITKDDAFGKKTVEHRLAKRLLASAKAASALGLLEYEGVIQVHSAIYCKLLGRLKQDIDENSLDAEKLKGDGS